MAGNFKLDPKKKIKSSQSESIMKSSGPLKATIPIKKVAPMIKTEPSAAAATSVRGKIPSASSSMTARPNTSLGIAGGPAACSTPAVFGSNKIKPVTPANRKSLLPPKSSSAEVVSNRRRTVEFKGSSPIKSRPSTVAKTVTTSRLGGTQRIATPTKPSGSQLSRGIPVS